MDHVHTSTFSEYVVKQFPEQTTTYGKRFTVTRKTVQARIVERRFCPRASACV